MIQLPPISMPPIVIGAGINNKEEKTSSQITPTLQDPPELKPSTPITSQTDSSRSSQIQNQNLNEVPEKTPELLQTKAPSTDKTQHTNEKEDLNLVPQESLEIISKKDSEEIPKEHAKPETPIPKLDEIETPGEICLEYQKLWLIRENKELKIKVFLCASNFTDDLFVIKEYAPTAISYDQMYQEIETLKNLSHPNIVKYYGVAKLCHKEGYGLLMEYMAGGSLVQFIKENSSVKPQHKLALVKEILNGLYYLHSQNIVHADLEPSNILLTNDKWNAKLTNMGVKPSVNIRFTAPEVLTDSLISFESDIWSFGCCCLHLLTGEVPFAKYQKLEDLGKVLFVQNPLEACSKEALKAIMGYPEMFDFIKACFNKKPYLRPSTSKLMKFPIFCN